MDKLNKARLFAIEAHGDQLYAGKPYIFHLTQVVNVLQEFGYDTDEDLLVAGYLHDTLEDTAVVPAQIQKEFGVRVYDMVFAVSGFGSTRENRTENTVTKLHNYPEAIALKMGDRLANMRFSSKDSLKHFNMYIDELPKYVGLFYGPMYYEMKGFK
jgi:(p)ppGpp synthase/HD superfamily hydrolase